MSDCESSSIPARSHTFVEIDHEIISSAILLPSADSRRVVVSYKRKYVHEVLVNRLVKLAPGKIVVRLTNPPNMTIAVDWDFKHQTKQTKSHPEPLVKFQNNFTEMFLIMPSKKLLKIIWIRSAEQDGCQS